MELIPPPPPLYRTVTVARPEPLNVADDATLEAWILEGSSRTLAEFAAEEVLQIRVDRPGAPIILPPKPPPPPPPPRKT